MRRSRADLGAGDPDDRLDVDGRGDVPDRHTIEFLARLDARPGRRRPPNRPPDPSPFGQRPSAA